MRDRDRIGRAAQHGSRVINRNAIRAGMKAISAPRT
jgi:hypothetical protein